MPNTPMVVGEGCTIYCPGHNVTQDDLSLIQSLLEVTGLCEQLPEKMINALAAISSSGPAFVCFRTAYPPYTTYNFRSTCL